MSAGNGVSLTTGWMAWRPATLLILRIPVHMQSHSACPTPALTVPVLAWIGALIGFFVYNRHPAKVFMGDTGSMALGALLAGIAILTKTELVLVLIAGIPVVEALSDIIQVVSFQLTGRRVFKMAPLHHHFELLGVSETTMCGPLGCSGCNGFVGRTMHGSHRQNTKGQMGGAVCGA